MAERDIDVTLFGATSVTGRQIARYLVAAGSPASAPPGPPPLEAPKSSIVNARRRRRGGRDNARRGRDRPRVAACHGGAHEGRPQPRRALHLLRPPRDRRLRRRRRPLRRPSGEMPFVARTTRDVHAEAEAAGVKVVQVCGFEALPPDLGVALAAKTARERHSEELASAEVALRTLQLPPGIPRPSDMVSGGTMQSLAQAIGEDDAERLLDPACHGLRRGALRGDPPRQPDLARAPARSADGAVMAPMAPAAFINPAVIHRSAASRDPPAPSSSIARAWRSTAALPPSPSATPPPAALSARPGRLRGRGRRPPCDPKARLRGPHPRPPGFRLRPEPGPARAVALAMDVNATTTSGQTVHVADRRGRPPRLPRHLAHDGRGRTDPRRRSSPRIARAA